jgi:hypothetical protein
VIHYRSWNYSQVVVLDGTIVLEAILVESLAAPLEPPQASEEPFASKNSSHCLAEGSHLATTEQGSCREKVYWIVATSHSFLFATVVQQVTLQLE